MMSNGRYTVVLKCLMDDAEVRPLLDKALSTYPLYEKKSKEEYIPSIVPTREQLNTKILNAYKYREIGFETIARFLDELEISMNEIMPYYNQLLFTADQDYNILYNVDYQRTTTTDREGSHSQSTTGTDNTSSTTLDSQNSETTTTENSETNASVNHNSKAVKSGTPQGELSITAANIDSVGYADEVNWNKDSNSDQATTQGTSTGNTITSGTGSNETTGEHSTSGSGTTSESESILETTKGNFGVMATQDLITKYRELIINIEQQIINDERISELFMRVY